MALQTHRGIIRVTAFVAAITAAGVQAQVPDGADRLSPVAVSESLKVLRTLERTVIRNRKDAESWYRRGMVAWALYERSRHQPPSKGLDWTLLIPLADTSLRRAVEIAPDNKDYFNSLARFLLSSGVTYRLYGPYGPFAEALEKARAGRDRMAHAEAALHVGRISWLRWDNFSCKTSNPLVEGRPRVIVPRNSLRDPLGHLRFADRDYMGETDYLTAELFFREAYDAAPAHSGVFRQYAMLLADQRRWMPLASLARSHINAAPTDGWGWMVLGLATHKVGDERAARKAFDSAFTLLDTADVKRLDRIERLMNERDMQTYATLTDSGRVLNDRFFWRNMVPIWSVPHLEPRLEFLARLTFAELRWTSEDTNLNGVNSDFGAWYVRTGLIPTNMGALDPAKRSQTDYCKPRRLAWYVKNDTTIVKGPEVQWTMLAPVSIDSIPVQVARFRAGHDTTEVLVATLPPVARIQRSAFVRAPVRTDFWLLAKGVDDVARDSVVPSTAGVVSFIQRVAPGSYLYRVEASADGSRVAGRGTAGFYAGDDDGATGFTFSGFGMSDVLVASSAQRDAGLRSWKDAGAVPLVGSVPRKSQITFVWENYDLAGQNGAAAYDVSITITREQNQSRAGRIAASIVGAFASAAGVRRTNDAVEFTLSRSVAHASLIVDNVALSLGDTPNGRYVLSVRVTDRNSGRTTGRSQPIVIGETVTQTMLAPGIIIRRQ